MANPPAPSPVEPCLQGKTIVVTRPRHQAQGLVDAISARGGRALLLPAMSISPVADWSGFDSAVSGLAASSWAIFVSRNAVEHALTRLQHLGITWPAPLRAAAIGSQTAKDLQAAGIHVACIPAVFSAEGLLAEAPFAQISGQQIHIFAGEGGREILADTLRARGAKVLEAICYYRDQTAADPTALLQQWAQGSVDAVTVTSPEIFRNFYQMIGDSGREWLRNTPIIAISPLTAGAVEAVGLPKPWIAKEASSMGLIQALEQWASA